MEQGQWKLRKITAALSHASPICLAPWIILLSVFLSFPLSSRSSHLVLLWLYGCYFKGWQLKEFLLDNNLFENKFVLKYVSVYLVL